MDEYFYTDTAALLDINPLTGGTTEVLLFAQADLGSGSTKWCAHVDVQVGNFYQ